MSKKPEQVKKPKGDPDKQFDVIIAVIHDDRKGITKPVEKPIRYSFATEAEAVAYSNKLKEVDRA